MSALTLDALCDRIASAKAPLILMHCRPDGDTVGSAAALMHLFGALGREARCLCADPIPKRLAFLMQGLNAQPPSLNESFTPIAVDVASRAQLGSLADVLIGELAPACMIDHHERGEEFTDCYRRADAAAAGEIVYDVAVHMLERRMLSSLPPALVDALFAAISSDTGCFRYSNTTEKTHRIASHLLSLGANAAEINRRLFDVKSLGQLRAESYIGAHARLQFGGKAAVATVTLALTDSLGLSSEDFETAIDVVRSLEGVELAIVLKETEPGKYKISLRSVSLDVSAIAASLGGGGHVRAAGCTVAAESAEAAETKILALAEEALTENPDRT